MSAQIKGTVTDSGNNPFRNAKVAIYSLPDELAEQVTLSLVPEKKS